MTAPQGPLSATGEGVGLAVPPTPPVVPPTGRWYQFPSAAGLVGRTAYLALLTFLTVIFIYPFLWAVSASLKPREEVFDNKLIPRHWQPSNYLDVFRGVPDIATGAPFQRWLINSLYIGAL